MPTVDERSLGVARLYAKAMLDIATEQQVADSLGEELDGVRAEMERDPEFANFLASPILERSKRKASLERALRSRASDLLVDSLQVVNRKDRLEILPQIIAAYHEEHREQLGQVEVKVSTAVPLTDEQRAYVRERARIRTGKDAHLTEKVNPELLGGLVIQVGDQKVDMSVRRDLELVSQRIAARFETELHREGAFSTDSPGAADAGDDAAASRDAQSPHDRGEEE